MDYKSVQEARNMTDEEHTARAMLIGAEYVKVDGGVGLYRKRLGPSFSGCAWFCYMNAANMKPVKGMEKRSELDQTIPNTVSKGAIQHVQKQPRTQVTNV